MSTQLNIYPAKTLERFRVDVTKESEYWRVQNALFGLRFTENYTNRYWEGTFNYRSLVKLNHVVENDYRNYLSLSMHPSIQTKFDAWVQNRNRLLAIKNQPDINLQDDYFNASNLWQFQRVDSKFALEAQKALLLEEMGSGKDQPLDTPILTPNGFIPMGTLQVGDQVFNSMGEMTKISHIFPQGQRPVYRITLTDGTSTECGIDHLWTVNSALRKWRGNSPVVMSTRQLLASKLQDAAGNNRFFIPVVEPIKFPAKELPIDPYLMGVLLGDGNFSNKAIRISSADETILLDSERLLPSEWLYLHKVEGKEYDWEVRSSKYGQNTLRHELDKLGLMGHKAPTKFIPPIYKYASTEQRLDLLKGLLDTDGSVSKTSIEYSSTSEQLMKDVVFLVQSLGGTAKISSRMTGNYYWDEYTEFPSFRTHISIGVNPFRLARKRLNYVQPTKYQPTRAIVSIDYIGEKETQCIKVESEDAMYLCNDCIVTHNTIIAASALEMARKFKDVKKVLVICPNQVRTNWKRELIKWTTIPTYERADGMIDSHHILVADDKATENRMLYLIASQTTEQETTLIVGWDTIRLPWFDEFLSSAHFDMIIADEAHRARNVGSSKTAKAFQTLHAQYQYALTGTAIVNYPEDLFALVHWLYPDQYPDYQLFSEDFVQRPLNALRQAGRPAKAKVVEEKLDLELDYMMVRRRKADVMKWLPAFNESKIYVELYPEQRKMYEQMRDELIAILEKNEADPSSSKFVTASIKLAQMMRLKQIAISPAAILARGADVITPEIAKIDKSPKLDWIEDWLDQNPDEKLVVFSQFEAVIKLLEYRILKMDRFKTAQDGYVFASGTRLSVFDKKYRDMKSIETAFQEDSRVKLWIGTLKTGGEGITLTAACNMILIDQWWNSAMMSQAAARIHRGGQTRPVQITNLVAVDTIEQSIFDLIETKRVMSAQTIDTRLLLDILYRDRDKSKEDAA